MDKQLIRKAEQIADLKYIFCDYYDTVIHRSVHPFYPFKLWAEFMIDELNLKLSVMELYGMRRAVLKHLCHEIKQAESELRYDMVMKAIYDRLVKLNTSHSYISFDAFLERSNEADYKAESSVQFVNKKTVSTLRFLKNRGYTVYCVSDFHSDEALLSRLLKYHGIDELYDKVFVSAALQASKENNGILFKTIMDQEAIAPKSVLMVGDNPISDVANSKLHGVESYYLKRYWYKFLQKVYFVVFSFKYRIF